MNCPDCQNQFSDFIDEEISLTMARSLKSHLAECAHCAAEWQLFQQTITTLHSFPVQKVPGNFVVGINAKLAPQPFFAKLKGWLSFMTQHKLTATTALATLAVGVISAAVLQLSPVGSEHTLAQKGRAETRLVAATTLTKEDTDYYPGIPYLAQNSQPSQLPQNRARVQFTPVMQSAPSAGHNSILDPRGPPSSSNLALLHPSLSRLKAVSPDLVVTVHPGSTAQQHALIRQLTTNRNWNTQISGNTLLVTLPCRHLTNFQDLFGPANLHINPRELSRLGQSSPSRLLTVAVAFR